MGGQRLRSPRGFILSVGTRMDDGADGDGAFNPRWLAVCGRGRGCARPEVAPDFSPPLPPCPLGLRALLPTRRHFCSRFLFISAAISHSLSSAARGGRRRPELLPPRPPFGSSLFIPLFPQSVRWLRPGCPARDAPLLPGTAAVPHCSFTPSPPPFFFFFALNSQFLYVSGLCGCPALGPHANCRKAPSPPPSPPPSGSGLPQNGASGAPLWGLRGGVGGRPDLRWERSVGGGAGGALKVCGELSGAPRCPPSLSLSFFFFFPCECEELKSLFTFCL